MAITNMTSTAQQKYYSNQICNHCGCRVHWGSGMFIDRVPDFNDIETRIDNHRPFPLGDFVCRECDEYK